VRPLEVLPAVYGAARRAGLLDRPFFRDLFVRAYFLYKRYLEDPFHALVRRRPELFRGGHILDVGANLGYNALLFARAADPGRLVYAFEPEAANFEVLCRLVRERSASGRVVPVRAAVGAEDGEVALWYNEGHHGDHRVATERFRAARPAARTTSVALRSVDSFAAEAGIEREIAFVKVDVQGYEEAVVRGMARTLSASPRAAVAIEYMPEAMADLGFDPAEMLRLLGAAGFSLFAIGRGGRVAAVDRARLEAMAARRGYVDLLCLREGAGAAP